MAECIAACDRALALDDSLSEVRADRGWARWKQADAAGARADLDQALERDPRLVVAWLRRAQLRRATSEIPGAMSDAHQAVELAPGNTAAILERAEIAAIIGLHAMALTKFDRLIELDPKMTEAWIGRGDVHRRKNQFPDAIQDLNRALQVTPRSAPAYATLGKVKLESRDHPGAYEALVRAQQLDPKNVEAIISMASLLYLTNQPQEAIEEVDKAIALDPFHGMAFVTRAHARVDHKDFQGALADFNQALRLAPGDARANLLVGRGDAHFRLGQTARAIADYRKALEATPPSEFARSSLMIATYVEGNVDEATHLCDELLLADPTDRDQRINRGLLLRDRGELDRAIPEFESVANRGSFIALKWWYISSREAGAGPAARDRFSRTIDAWQKDGLDQWAWVLGLVLVGNMEATNALTVAPGSENEESVTFRLARRDVLTMEAYRIHLAGDDALASATLAEATADDDRIELERFIHLHDVSRWSKTPDAKPAATN